MLLNACVVLDSTQRKLFGWQIIQAENPEETYSALLRTSLEPCLPSVSETLHYSIKSVFVGKSKEQLDKVCRATSLSLSLSLSLLSLPHTSNHRLTLVVHIQVDSTLNVHEVLGSM